MLDDGVQIRDLLVGRCPNRIKGGLDGRLVVCEILQKSVRMIRGGAIVVLRQNVHGGHRQRGSVAGGGVHIEIDSVQGHLESVLTGE